MGYNKDLKLWSFANRLNSKINKRIKAGYNITSIRLSLSEFNRLCAEYGYLQWEEFPEDAGHFKGIPIKERK